MPAVRKGKGRAQHVERESARQVAADVGYALARATRCRKHGRRGRYDAAWTSYSVLVHLVQSSVRVVGVRTRSEFGLSRNCHTFFREEIQIASANRSVASSSAGAFSGVEE